MTREEIEQLDNTEPYSFETDREEWWYEVGLKEGLKTADQHPRKGLWDAEKVVKWLETNLAKFGCFNCFIEDHKVESDIIKSLRDAMEE